jgi:hypothetical protein
LSLLFFSRKDAKKHARKELKKIGVSEALREQ